MSKQPNIYKLSEIEKNLNFPRSKSAKRISSMMENYYTRLKNQNGLQKMIQPDEIKSLSDATYSKLRPLTPFRLDEIDDQDSQKRLIKRSKSVSKMRDKSPILNPSILEKRRSLNFQNAKPKNKWIYTPKIHISPTKSNRLLPSSQSQTRMHASVSYRNLNV